MLGAQFNQPKKSDRTGGGLMLPPIFQTVSQFQNNPTAPLLGGAMPSVFRSMVAGGSNMHNGAKAQLGSATGLSQGMRQLPQILPHDFLQRLITLPRLFR